VEPGAFATEITQVLNEGQPVMEYIRQGEELATKVRMYADVVRNVENLPSWVFGSISADINALASIVRAAGRWRIRLATSTRSAVGRKISHSNQSTLTLTSLHAEASKARPR
jgi:P-type conjugative transfer protein TrbJ